MTPTEATTLAKRIINTWNGGPRLDEWGDALQPLEHEHAHEVFTKLRAQLEHAPSIARLMSEYRCHLAPERQSVTPAYLTVRNPISLADYLERLTTRADAGNPEAQQELAAWNSVR